MFFILNRFNNKSWHEVLNIISRRYYTFSKVAKEHVVEDEDKIRKALLKKALGYNADEVIEEYTFDDEGQLKLSKKKVTKKHFSPDISAVKVLLERYYKTYEDKIVEMSDDELLLEKARLESILKEDESGD